MFRLSPSFSAKGSGKVLLFRPFTRIILRYGDAFLVPGHVRRDVHELEFRCIGVLCRFQCLRPFVGRREHVGNGTHRADALTKFLHRHHCAQPNHAWGHGFLFQLRHRFQAGVAAARKIGNRLIRFVAHYPALQKIVGALIDTLIGFHGGIQGNVSEALGGVLLWRLPATSELSKDVTPPAIEARPAAVMAVRVVSCADVRVGSGQVSIDQRLRKAGRAIIDINVDQFIVPRNGDLNRGRSVLQPVTSRKALVKNGVVAIAKELLAAAQDVNRFGSGTHTSGTGGRRLHRMPLPSLRQ